MHRELLISARKNKICRRFGNIALPIIVSYVLSMYLIYIETKACHCVYSKEYNEAHRGWIKIHVGNGKEKLL